jgi:hypothetical protein
LKYSHYKQNWQEITTEIPTLEKLGFDAFIPDQGQHFHFRW